MATSLSGHVGKGSHAAATSRPGAPRRRRQGYAWLQQVRVAGPFILPYAILFGVFGLYPTILAVWMSFFEWPPLGESTFVGLANYVALLADPKVGQSIVNVLTYIVLHLAGTLVLSTLLALAMSTEMPLRGILRTMYFSPAITSLLVMSIIWSWIFAHNGALNFALGFLGVPEQQWLNNPDLVMPSLAFMNVQRGAGFYAIIIMAGIQSIPREMFEASAIDGASGWQTFWRVTLPLLVPTIELVVVLCSIWGFMLFTEPYVMTRGGPLNRSMTLAYHAYLQAFQFWKMGYAAAVGMVLLGIAFTATYLERRLLGRQAGY